MGNRPHIEISYNYLNKKNENLCGDKVQVFKSDDRSIIVLADGLGSGVKANILATLTSKIAITMLKRNAGIEEVVDTVIHTLPVCSVRKIAYSTFTIVEIDRDMNCRIFEYDNPDFFLIRGNRLGNPSKREILIGDKKVSVSEFRLRIGDELYICSDGVVHAGAGRYLAFGWKWEDVASYILRRKAGTAFESCSNLLESCYDLYDGKPDDDTTVAVVKVRQPVELNLFAGPPVNREFDKPFIELFRGLGGKKIISGGTAAKIFSRVTGNELVTNLNYIDRKVPLTASMKEVDLVTEGIVTMNRCVELIERFEKGFSNVDLKKKDGATRMLRMFLEDCTHIRIWFGKAVNPAHQRHGFPSELSLKINVVNRLVDALGRIGKEVRIEYISEINYEIV